MSPFAALAGELAGILVAERIDHVVGDACEGYNPAHDLCCVLIEAAVALAGGVPSLDFPLTGHPDAPAHGRGDPALTLSLDDAAFARKRAAAAAYPELAAEVRAVVKDVTAAAFRREYLRRVPDSARLGSPPADPPYYETYGERQVPVWRSTDAGATWSEGNTGSVGSTCSHTPSRSTRSRRAPSTWPPGTR